MPHYFFDIHGAHCQRDINGYEAPNPEGVRAVAIATAGRHLVQNAASICMEHSWLMDVADELGNVVYQIAIITADPSNIEVSRNTIPTLSPQ